MKTKILAFLLALLLMLNCFMVFSCVAPPEAPPDDDPPVDNPPSDPPAEEPPVDNPPSDPPADEPPVLDIDNPEKFADFKLTSNKIYEALDAALKKIDYCINTYGVAYPGAYSTNNVYKFSTSNKSGWVQGFWPGTAWNAYGMTGDTKYSNYAMSFVPAFSERVDNKLGLGNHDMGFLYVPSCVAAYKEFGDEAAKQAALKAADLLIERYHEDAKFIQAWGDLGDPNEYRLIIDTLMNLSLLYFASEETGDPKYADIAYNHYKTTMKVIYREDGGSYHTYYFDPVTKEPAYGKTKQGYADDSTWSRGQAWGMYGSIITYIHTGDESCLDDFKLATNHFLNNLPDDYVSYWDFTFTGDPAHPRDSSATAIAVCALLESLDHLGTDDPYYDIYKNAAYRMMNGLIETCSSKDLPECNGLLLHGNQSGANVFNETNRKGVDEMMVYGDYFYMEALRRLLDKSWDAYW